MARPLRILFPGAFYHVVNRGNNRSNIFFGEEDMELFLAVLEESQKLHSVNVLAFCLMHNHYHLLVHTPKANLSRFMRHLNGLFTQRMNRVHKRDGHLFRGRYKAVLVQEDRYLANAIRYIHLNPIKAGLIQDPLNWKYSSHRYLMGTKGLGWLDIDRTLRVFGCTVQEARDNYQAFMEEGIDDRTRKFYSQKRLLSVFGDKGFREELLKERLRSDPDLNISEVTDLKVAETSVMTERVLTVVHLAFGLTQDEPKAHTRGKTDLALLATVGLLRDKANLSHAQIQKLLGIKSYKSSSSSYRRLGERIKRDPEIKELYESLSLSCGQAET